MTIIYQLVAKGPSATFESIEKVKSKKVFASKAGAEAYVDEFILLCTTETDPPRLNTLERVDKIIFLELELVDDTVPTSNLPPGLASQS